MRLFVIGLYAVVLSACVWIQRSSGPETSPTAETEIIVASFVSATGEACAGIAGISCAEGDFCKMDIGACVSVADASGTCEQVNAMCTREYRPVCGCDGETYPNACEAYAASVSIASEGACDAGIQDG